MDEFIGIIKLFGGTFAPRGWALCDGSLVAINANTALFSILGTAFGGNGTTNFGIPDLRGKTAIGTGLNPQGRNYVLGEIVGTETVPILVTNMPAHTHIATTKVNNAEGNLTAPVAGSSLSAMVDTSVNQILSYNNVAPTIALNATTTTNAAAGGNVPLPIMQPSLALTYIICLQGLYPSRN